MSDEFSSHSFTFIFSFLDMPIDENDLLDEDESANVDDMINEESDSEVPVDTDKNENVNILLF